DFNGYLGVAATGTGLAHSTDGINWSEDLSGTTANGVRWAGNKWIASGNVVRISGDGTHWSIIYSQSTNCVGAMSKFGAVESVSAISLKSGEKLSVVSPHTYSDTLIPDTMITLALNLP
ncbi:MAG: hypothetical protein EBX50_23195, partial [Chitinophagia bacterium]|nr:hypothetical protein [Chitinophagia bacterium]